MKVKNLVILGVLLAVLVMTSYSAYQGYLNQELWGHLPLYIFASAWVLLGGLTYYVPLLRNLKSHKRWMALSSISGALFALGFPPFYTTFTILFAFIPLFYIEDEIAQDETIVSKKWLITGYGYFIFVMWNLLSTYWVANTAFVAGVFAIIANSALMLIPLVLFVWFKDFVGKRTAYFSFAAFWICFEYLHMNWEVTWPWLTLGNSLSQFAWLPQWYEYTGVLGGSLWILLLNIFGYDIIQKKRFGGLSNRRVVFYALLLLGPTIYSISRYLKYQEQGEKVEVVIVQPNYEPHYQKFTIPGFEQAEHFASLSRTKLTDKTTYLLFPETAFDNINVDRFDQSIEAERIKTLLLEFPNLIWVTGLSAHKIFPKYVPNRPNLRTLVRSNETIYWEAYNAAVQTNNDLTNIDWYYKSKLVPGPEIFPYKDQLRFMKSLVEKLDGTVEGLATQPERSVFKHLNYAVAPIICYESIFGEYCTDYVKNGATALFIMTNDGWWDHTPGHIQHLKFGTLRAIETRRSIARSANSGISCFINQRGDILQATRYDEAVAINGEISMNSLTTTFYTEWGDIIGRLALMISSLQMLYLVFGILKRRFKIL
jgi:apolipoprotein N-acyltransferase